MKTAVTLLTLACLPLLATAADAPGKPESKDDPIAGRWRPTNTGIPITLKPDGTASDTRAGKWVCLNPKATPRKYQVTWNEGEAIDTLSLVKGGKELVGENQDGTKLRWTRLPSK